MRYSGLKRIATLAVLLLAPITTHAQQAAADAPCGVVDSIDYPLEDLVEGYDDFALFRRRFGGLHTGLDIGFNQWGDPVYAAARGRVTYSDIEGWDTEKGVVIVEHTLPDGSVVYSLYGHMEQTDDLFFPEVGQCVERGDPVGAIGWPSRGLPHLHYEIRSFLPDNGGPGYVDDNPLKEGWFHPLDFTETWRARLEAGYIRHTTFDIVPHLPPVALDNGTYALANGDGIQGSTATGEVIWRVKADGVITGLSALPGNRVAAHTRNGQALILQNGRYLTLWTVRGPDVPFIANDNLLVFAANDGLAAYDLQGNALWTLPLSGNFARVTDFQMADSQIALGLRGDDGVVWRLIDLSGQVVYETTFDSPPLAAAQTDGRWAVLSGRQLEHIVPGQRQTLATLDLLTQFVRSIATDPAGNNYIYAGGVDNSLKAVGPQGDMLWDIDYPNPTAPLPPLMQTDHNCRLYTLDADGMLNVFDTADGALLNQVSLYAGGSRNTSPAARLLHLSADGQLQVGSGFLTLITFDSRALAGERAAQCAPA